MNEEQDFIEKLLSCTGSDARFDVIPEDINYAIGKFRRAVDELREDIEQLPIVIIYAGELARKGQYGYVDLVNEQYIWYDQHSSQAALPFPCLVDRMLKHLEILQRDFFDRELEEGDRESAEISTDDVEAIMIWAKLTDQYDTSVILHKAQVVLNYMKSKLKETN